MSVVIGIGTVKGAWFASSDDRRSWRLSGPHHRGWEVTTFGMAPGGDYLLATGSNLRSGDPSILGPRAVGAGDRRPGAQGAIRPHVSLFHNEEAVRTLTGPVDEGDTVTVLQAVSGGTARR